MELELFLSKLGNRIEPGLRSHKNQELLTLLFLKRKIKVRGVFFQKNLWNLSVNLNFENFDFLLMSLSKFGYFTTMYHQFVKIKPIL